MRRKFTDQAAPLFRQLYIDEGLNSVKMGKLLGLTPSNVCIYLRRFDIPVRSVGEAHKGVKQKPRTEEHCRKISENTKKQWEDEEYRRNMSEYMTGRTGKLSNAWKGGVSFEPYCPKFNEKWIYP